MAITFGVGAFILNKTYFGRYFYAVGGNEEASRLSGIKVNSVKFMIYALSGFFAVWLVSSCSHAPIAQPTQVKA
jgi:ribose transport system permease protein